MNIDDLRNDIEEWRYDYNEPEYADLLEEMLVIYEYEQDKDKFLKLKEKHFKEFSSFQYPNCFDEDILT